MKYSNLITLLTCLLNLWTNYHKVDAALEAEGIIGGDQAISDQFSYMVSLQDSHKVHHCGGGIIGDRHILTAAHCVVKPTGAFRNIHLVAVINGLNLNDTSEYVVQVPVQKIIVPKEYQPVNRTPRKPYRPPGDIAVLVLKNSIGLYSNPRLQKLELPQRPYSKYVNEKVVVAGYGDTSINLSKHELTNREIEGEGYSDNQLHFAEAVVITNEKCNKIVGKPVLPSYLCAQVVQRSADHPEGICSGDSGGPLVYDGKTVIGVVSTSPTGCIENKSSGVYTRVSSFIRFITNAVADKVLPDIMRIAVDPSV